MIIPLFKTLYKTFAFLLLITPALLALKPGEDTSHALKVWSSILENPEKLTPEQVIDFLKTHSHWPYYKKLCKNAESIIARRASSQQIRSWFSSYPPQTFSGIVAYATVLPHSQVPQFVGSTWEKQEMTHREEKQFLAQFGKYLSEKNHSARLDHLLWCENIEGAQRLLPRVPPRTQHIAKMRLAFLQGRGQKTTELVKNEGLLYLISRGYKESKEWLKAAKILISTPSSRAYADKWWKVRSYIARELIQLKQFKKAYLVVKKHNLEPGTKEFSEAEWLLGWLSLRFLKNPQEAQQHFSRLVNNVKAAISVSRATYWLARSYEAQNKLKLARHWYNKSAHFKTTFYGQLSAHKIRQSPYPKLHPLPRATAEEKKLFEQKDLVKAARHLKKQGKHTEDAIVSLLTCLASQAETRAERELVVHLAHTLAPHAVVWIARKAGNQDPVLLKIAYPVCQLPQKRGRPENELLFAIAYQESHFNPKAVSHKGAKGLLQLVSSAASDAAKQLGLRHSDAKLFDPAHNLILGSTHVSSLLNKYNHAYPLVTAAYNAGPTPLERWLRDFGRPHAKEVDILDWIELIPYAETRNYVQRVLETLTVYRGREGKPRKTLVDDLKHG